MLKKIVLTTPLPEDGLSVFNLVKACPPLDQNSAYCNLLQCHHFSGTSVAAKSEGNIVGFASGYLIPDRPHTLFIWQIAVSEEARGCGLASRMIEHILERDCCQDIHFVETSITEGNKASWALFERFAQKRAAPIATETLFDETRHFFGKHATEVLVKIGPFTASAVADHQPIYTNANLRGES